MTNKSAFLKKILALLCVFLILAYALVVFLPHTHCCCDISCAACNVIESCQKILYNILLFAVIYPILKFIYFIERICYRILSVRDQTPVGLKVKLSN